MKIVSSGALLRFLDYQKEIDVEVRTLGEGLTRLATQYPEIRRVLFDGQGRLQSFNKLYLNADRVTEQDLAREVGPNDELQIVTAVAGG